MISIISMLILTLISIKFYKYMICCVCECTTDLNGKTVIITGGGRGIGKQTARLLALVKARVIIGSKNPDMSERSVQELKPSENIEIVAKYLDLSSFDSIRNFAEDINRNEKNVSILICNAAKVPPKGK